MGGIKAAAQPTEVAMLEQTAAHILHVAHQMQQRVCSIEEELDWMHTLAGNTSVKENYAGSKQITPFN